MPLFYFVIWTHTELVESTDYQILEKELERANFYLNSAQHILDDYKDYYCKRVSHIFV